MAGYRPSRLPLVPATLEEFGEFVRAAFEIHCGVSYRSSMAPMLGNVRWNDLYNQCAFKARELDIPLSYLMPLASVFSPEHLLENDPESEMSVFPQPAQGHFLVASRPPGYLTSLHNLIAPANISLTGSMNDVEHVPLSFVLPPEFCETVLLVLPRTMSREPAYRRCNALLDYSGTGPTPNFQSPEFYRRVANGTHFGPYLFPRRTIFNYIPYIRYATIPEVESFFDRMRPGQMLSAPAYDLTDGLMSMGVATNIISEALQAMTAGSEAQLPLQAIRAPIPEVSTTTDVVVPEALARRPSRHRSNTLNIPPRMGSVARISEAARAQMLQRDMEQVQAAYDASPMPADPSPPPQDGTILDELAAPYPPYHHPIFTLNTGSVTSNQ